MARTIPENRLVELLDCATRVFIAQGYRRTQIADVASGLGVAKGTVYLYVESKEALFAAALRHADGAVPATSQLTLPLATPAPGELLTELAERLSEEALPGSLERALARRRTTDASVELEEIVRELYAISSRHRVAAKLIDCCGRDHPELAKIYYDGGRFAQLELLTRYLESRIRRGRLRAVPDPAVAARFVIESVATWAIHIHWDPAPQPIDPHLAEETVVHFIVGSLVP